LYMNSGSNRDSSTERNINVNLPAKYLVDNMQLVQHHNDGRFYDKSGDLVAFDAFHGGIEFPKTVFVKKSKLIDFLNDNGLRLFWILSGKKETLGSHSTARSLGWLEITGAFRLDMKGGIQGGIQTKIHK